MRMVAPAFQHYTHITTLKDDIAVRLRDPDTRVGSFFTIPYQPKTYTPCAKHDRTGKWRTLDERPVRQMTHATITDWRRYVERAEQDGREIYGNIIPVHQFMAEAVPVDCGVPFESLRTVYLDIETQTRGGFAPPDDPFQPITAITVEVWGQQTIWGMGDYTPTDTEVYVKCKDELDLLTSFVRWWVDDYPDIVTGWNTAGYDIPYLCNRIDRLAKKSRLKLSAKLLSPWRKIGTRQVTIMGRDQTYVDIVGVNNLDYLDLYKKFGTTQRESYRLDAIAEAELGERKIAYDEYGSLDKLAEQSYQTFIAYNRKDVSLVRKLNDKLHHLDLCVQMSYDARVNYPDTFKQVRMWDAIMYYELHAQHIVIPPKPAADKSAQFAGAYVKDPIVGTHRWVVSFDVNSLYPSIMREWNISPDRHLPCEWLEERYLHLRKQYGDPTTPPTDTSYVTDWVHGVTDPNDARRVVWALRTLLEHLQQTSVERLLDEMTGRPDTYPFLSILGVCMSANGQAFRSDQEGFLPGILGRLYRERKKHKNLSVMHKKELERVHQEMERRGMKHNAK